ncbi:hypothetical protein FGO68_gene10708 [Halteria grandinella]|uniref:Uncharacterized protein n=1 Tax=Halteria grandinella TaxID=5974 RepID=A0A8J8TAA8_HALGN|nr:hypothetical protein FGO68_gene10708 [Halteria grandinella]
MRNHASYQILTLIIISMIFLVLQLHARPFKENVEIALFNECSVAIYLYILLCLVYCESQDVRYFVSYFLLGIIFIALLVNLTLLIAKVKHFISKTKHTTNWLKKICIRRSLARKSPQLPENNPLSQLQERDLNNKDAQEHSKPELPERIASPDINRYDDAVRDEPTQNPEIEREQILEKNYCIDEDQVFQRVVSK